MRTRMLCLAAVLAAVCVGLATVVMSYISLAVPIGPWIEPTIAFLAIIAVLCCAKWIVSLKEQEKLTIIGLVTIAGGIGGIVASACAWSIPSLYFLDRSLFVSWMGEALHFWYFVGALVFVSGAFGLAVVRYAGTAMVHDNSLIFPVAQMLQKTITAYTNVRRGYELLLGMLGSLILSVLYSINCLPAKLLLFKSRELLWLSLPSVTLYLNVAPMLWSIGFVTGHMIAVPFAVGMIAKFLLLAPLQKYYFSYMSLDSLLLAFCSGIIVQGTFMSFVGLPGAIWLYVKKMCALRSSQRIGGLQPIRNLSWEAWGALLMVVLLLVRFSFSWMAQIFIVVATLICVYQLMLFMAKVGLAPLGRFATFVMLPGLVVYGFSYTQAVVAAAFVEIAGGVAAAAVSGQKLAELLRIDSQTTYRFQWAALCICSLVIGIVVWLFFTSLGIGTPELMAQKAHARALLIQVHDFHYLGIALGLVFGFILKSAKINTSLALGGLLMQQVDWSMLLILSGLSTYLVKNKERYYPFWSGVYTASSLWMLLRAFW